MNCTNTDRKQSLFLKNNLLKLNIEQIKKHYFNEEGYYSFLVGINGILETEKAFLLLDENTIDTIQRTLVDLRFSSYLQKESIPYLNKIIVELNILNSLSLEEKDSLVSDYWINQERMRIFKALNSDDLSNCISYDAVAYHLLTTEDLDLLDRTLFLSSTNYFLNAHEYLYEEPTILDTTEKIIESFCNQSASFSSKIYAKETMESLKKVKVKKG